MRSLIKKGLRTIQNDGIKVFMLRIRNYAIVKLKRLVRKKDLQNLEKWKVLKNKYEGERIFLIGNGPSLNKMPLYLLKDEYTMCFNRFNLLHERIGWKPYFYVVTDDLVIKDNYKEINTELLPYVKYGFFPDIHPSNIEVTHYIKNRDNVNWIIADKPEFRADLPNCGHNKTVVNAGLQIAAFLGFTKIYLIGVDMTFEEQKVKKINLRDWEAEEDDPNHFDPRYFKKGFKYHNPTVHEILEQFAIGKTFFDKLGISILNAGVGGKLEIFPRVEFNSLFNLSDTEQETLLSNIDFLKQSGITINNLDEASIYSEDNNSDIFKINSTDAIKLIPKLIMQYLPVGPYKNYYYFIKR
ncbi:MAG: 6-hydroxymethylpterin diphosphokinase MptE-like protein [Ginsengibacter sp.]